MSSITPRIGFPNFMLNVRWFTAAELRWGDAEPLADNKGRLHFRRSKTDTDG